MQAEAAREAARAQLRSAESYLDGVLDRLSEKERAALERAALDPAYERLLARQMARAVQMSRTAP